MHREQARSRETLAGNHLLLGLLLLTQCLVVLLDTSLALALPGIEESLGFAPHDLQWVLTTYMIGFGGLLILGGRTADLFGRRRILVAGLTVFALASLLCALAWSPLFLSVARAAQGGGAAFASAAALSIVTVTFTGAARRVALSAWGIVSGASASVGLVLGGIAADLLGWRWVFGLIFPIAASIAVLSLRFVPSSARACSRRPLDVPGAVLCASGIAALVLGASAVQDTGAGGLRTWGGLLSGGVLLCVFLLWERHAADPLVPLWAIGRRLTGGANLASGTLGAVLLGVFLGMSLYLQEGRSLSPVVSGLQMLPTGLVSVVAGLAVGRMVGRVGPRPVILAGLLVLATGSLALAVVAAAESLIPFLAASLLFGLGVSMAEVSSLIGATEEFGHGELAGLASGLWSTAFQLCGAIGVAVVVTLAAGSGAGSEADAVDGFEQAAAVGAAMALAGALLAAPLLRQRAP